MTTLTITNMQVIITKIGSRIGQSCKIRSNVPVRTSIQEPISYRNRTNSKMSRGLVVAVAKLSTLRGVVAEGEAELTLDNLLKRPVRRPLPRTNRLSGLLPVALLLVCRGRRMNNLKISLVLAVIPTTIEALGAAWPASITAEIKLVLTLGKVSRGQQRRCR